MTLLPSPHPFSPRQKALAWSVHILTALGFLVGLLAIHAILENNWQPAFFWVCVSIFIDSVDGTLARRFRVKEVVPFFDGALLDNIVDYFTYVLVPTFLIWQAELVPPSLMLVTITLITLSSAYQFCRTDAKTEDHFFLGFPSYWNLLVIYLFVAHASPWTNFVILLIFAILVFVPIKYLYPSRTVAFRKLTLVLSLLWAVAFAAIILLYPATPRWLIHASLLYAVYYVALSLWLTVKGTGGR